MKYLLWHLFPYGRFIAGYLFLKNLNAASRRPGQMIIPKKNSAPVPDAQACFQSSCTQGRRDVAKPDYGWSDGRIRGKQLRLSAGATLVLGRDSEHWLPISFLNRSRSAAFIAKSALVLRRTVTMLPIAQL